MINKVPPSGSRPMPGGARRRAPLPASKPARPAPTAASPSGGATPGPRAKPSPANASAPTVTKAKMRQTVCEMLERNRAAGVPDDGIAEIVTQWVIAHLVRGTRVIP